MLKFQEKRKLMHIMFSKTTIILLLIIIVLMAFATYNAYQGKQEAIARRAVLTDEIERLEEREQALNNAISTLEDPRGVEAELRRRFDVAKEGEEVIVLIEKKKEALEQINTQQKEKTLFDYSNINF